MNEPPEAPATIEHWRTRAALANRARRKHSYGRRRKLARGSEAAVVVDDAAPRSHLVKIVVEAIGRHRKYLDDLARRNVSFADGDGAAGRVPIELQHGVVG